jgi:hypothetical protein
MREGEAVGNCLVLAAQNGMAPSGQLIGVEDGALVTRA